MEVIKCDHIIIDNIKRPTLHQKLTAVIIKPA
jgi:hypothetical protein